MRRLREAARGGVSAAASARSALGSRRASRERRYRGSPSPQPAGSLMKFAQTPTPASLSPLWPRRPAGGEDSGGGGSFKKKEKHEAECREEPAKAPVLTKRTARSG